VNDEFVLEMVHNCPYIGMLVGAVFVEAEWVLKHCL